MSRGEATVVEICTRLAVSSATRTDALHLLSTLAVECSSALAGEMCHALVLCRLTSLECVSAVVQSAC